MELVLKVFTKIHLHPRYCAFKRAEKAMPSANLRSPASLLMTEKPTKLASNANDQFM